MGENFFNRFGTMIDCSRGMVMNVDSVKRWIDITSDLGYNTLMLYTEDTYEIEGQPYFGYMRGRYSQKELKEIDAYAITKNMKLIPCIQTLAHLESIFRWNVYKSTVHDCNDILLCENEKTYELIDDMFRALSNSFTSRTVNIGMDEAHMLGRGKYKDLFGDKNSFDILLKHLIRVSEIAKQYGFHILMWGDMFFRLLNDGEYYGTALNIPKNIENLIPDNVNLVYWDYYSHDKKHYENNIRSHKLVKDNIWFAGGMWSWSGYAPHNKFSIEAVKPAFEACIENGVKDVFLTMWGDDCSECSRFALLPTLYYASQIAKGNSNPELIKTGFKEKFGIDFDHFMLLDLPNTPNNINNDKIFNPERYMFYSDLFFGFLDSTVKLGDAKGYEKCGQMLSNFVNQKDFGYIFKTMKNLCDVLSVKYELGYKTRNAYQSNDKQMLENLLGDYDLLLERLDLFYNSYHYQWFKENKPNGFETIDIRIGGVIMRANHCKKRILDYLNNVIPEIPELEERLLDSTGDGEGKFGSPISFTNWKLNSMIDII